MIAGVDPKPRRLDDDPLCDATFARAFGAWGWFGIDQPFIGIPSRAADLLYFEAAQSPQTV
jgi:hypothetical protein